MFILISEEAICRIEYSQHCAVNHGKDFREEKSFFCRGEESNPYLLYRCQHEKLRNQ
jgi:hypothetical protein